MEPLAIFVHSGKGGVGKSTYAKGLVDYYRTRKIDTAAYDCDTGTESLYSFYAERDVNNAIKEIQNPLTGVVPFSIRSDRERDYIVNLLGDTEAPRRIIDLPGGAANEVSEVLGNADKLFAAYEKAGLRPVVVLVIDHIKSSAASVTDTIQTFGRRPHYIAVKNLGKADEIDFEIFDGFLENGKQKFGKARRLLEEAGGEITTMPKMETLTFGRIDRLGLSWAEAERSPALSTADRLRVGDWREQFAAATERTKLAIGTAVVPV